jgi:hypothetical protein
MPQTIVRMFDSPETAKAAAAALREAGFTDVHSVISVISESDEGVVTTKKGAAVRKESAAGASMSYDNIRALIGLGGMLTSDPKAYVEGVSRGKSVVAVHPPFGRALGATEILNRFGPPDSVMAESYERLESWDDAAPLSSTLGIPVLVRDSTASAELSSNPAPLSSALGLPLLSRTRSNWTSSFGLPLLSKSQSGWTKSFGFSLLSKSQSGWRSSFGLPLLSNSQGGWTSSFGLRLLSRNAAPLSSLFCIPVLIRDRASRS